MVVPGVGAVSSERGAPVPALPSEWFPSFFQTPICLGLLVAHNASTHLGVYGLIKHTVNREVLKVVLKHAPRTGASIMRHALLPGR